MLLSDKKLPFIAFLLVTWALATATFFVGRWTADPVTRIVEVPPNQRVEPKKIEEPATEPAPASLTITELARGARWDEAIARCDTIAERWTPECENIELILGRALANDHLHSRLKAIGFLATKGLDFAPHNPNTMAAPNVSFTQDEVIEVTGWCALARQTQPEACRGLESLLAAGMFASGDVESIPMAYAKMRRMGVVPLERLNSQHYQKAFAAFRRNEFARAVRHCEHGAELGNERCVALLAVALERLGDRRAACEVFAGIPDAELPFRCGRRAVSKQVVKRMKRAYVTGENGRINEAVE